MIYLTLFWEFAKVGIFCVGGGYASMPLIQAAVVALIAAASISFVILALWNVETLPEDMAAVDPLGVIILAGSLAAVRRKVGVIKLLAGTGVAGLVLGIIQQSLH